MTSFEEYLRNLISLDASSKEFAGFYRKRTKALVLHFRNYLGEDFFKGKTEDITEQNSYFTAMEGDVNTW